MKLIECAPMYNQISITTDTEKALCMSAYTPFIYRFSNRIIFDVKHELNNDTLCFESRNIQVSISYNTLVLIAIAYIFHI